MGALKQLALELVPAAHAGDDQARLTLLTLGADAELEPVPESLAQAAAYRSLGWSIVPQLAGAKMPRIRWKEFQERLPTVDEVQEWWTRWPHAGIALTLGPTSGVFAVDVDGPEGHAALVQHLGGVPKAPRSISGSAKPHRYHLIFQHPEVQTNARYTPWHEALEFRGHGGIIVLPPSKHKSGHSYRWADGRSIFELAPPPVPPAIFAALKTRAKGLASHKIQAASAVGTASSCSATRLGNFAAGLADSTRLFLQGAYANGPDWNAGLFKAACDLFANGVSEAAAVPLLLAGARPWNEAERQAALATIGSAFAQPRYRAKRRQSHLRWAGYMQEKRSGL